MEVTEYVDKYQGMTGAQRRVHKHLKESSLGRLAKHAKDPATCFGVISAYIIDGPGALDDDENVKLSFRLAAEARRAGFGYVWLKGYWIADKGTPEERQVEEASLFIPGKPGQSKALLDFLEAAAKRYSQVGFLYRPEGQAEVEAHGGGSPVKIGQFNPDKMATMFSKIAKGRHGGRPFVFEAAMSHRTPMEGLLLRAMLLQKGHSF